MSPPPVGADVITCSLTPGAGAPLSGTAKATLDFVTTFGRGGKGTMCFFSTGNANANNVTARPYGAYEKCFAIAATSIDNDGVTEIRAPYSGWGQIDFCAPSQDALGTVHNVLDVVVTGPANHRNDFGGTSSATPLAAGVAALVLSANPDLTYIEAREVMRNTAIKLDPGNTTANGQWLDINGNPSVTSGLPPVRSGWYGFGRIDAAAAVLDATTFAASRDLVIRDNLADTGAVATAGNFWNSPDIWCRTTAPASDPGALPPNYATAGPHQTPIRSQNNWIYLRVRNNGTAASLDAWVRISITHWPGLEFTYPNSWQPTNGPGDPLPSPMTPGTYFIGEAKISGLAAGADETVVVEWPAGLIPPATVTTSAGVVTWHPCLLAEITPHDGPTPTGNHVWDDNNLAQKNISIVGTDTGTDFKVATVVGSAGNEAECTMLEINRGRLPRAVRLYVDLMDRRLWKGLAKQLDEQPNLLVTRKAAFGLGAGTAVLNPKLARVAPKQPWRRIHKPGWEDRDATRPQDISIDRPFAGPWLTWRNASTTLPRGYSRVIVQLEGKLPGGAVYRRVALHTVPS